LASRQPTPSGGSAAESGAAAAQAHFRATVMAKKKKPTEVERFAETHSEGVVNT
jgi:hypothetical protein